MQYHGNLAEVVILVGSPEDLEARKRRNERRRNIRLSDNMCLEDRLQKLVKMSKGEKALWRAVLLQMVVDAKYAGTKPMDEHNKAVAEHWLERKHKDMAMVCDLAGFDLNYIFEQIEEARDRGFQWRAGPKNKK